MHIWPTCDRNVRRRGSKQTEKTFSNGHFVPLVSAQVWKLQAYLCLPPCYAWALTAYFIYPASWVEPRGLPHVLAWREYFWVELLTQLFIYSFSGALELKQEFLPASWGES